MVINWYEQETYSLKHTGDFTKYTYKKVLLFYRQCSPLSGPMRSIIPSDFRLARCFSTAFGELTHLFPSKKERNMQKFPF
jgi:hypothetical protein